MARRAAVADRQRRARPRRADPGRAGAAGARPGPGLEAGPEHALRQHHPGGRAAQLPGRPGDGRAAGVHHALERAGHGGAGQQGLRRAGRPHRQLRQRGGSVRGRLQPLLPRRRGRPRRRPGVLPAAQRARCLRPRLSGRAAQRGRPGALPAGNRGAGAGRARPVQLPAPLADARFLAVPHRLHGPGADQLDLPRALHALPERPRSARLHGPQGLGRVRRRRDGRARKHVRAHIGRARAAGQPGLGGQLQPAAARRPGARQRPHHRRAGAPVRRRRLARDQAGLGQRLGRPVRPGPQRRAAARLRADGGRPVPDLRGQERPLQPRELLRPERRAGAPGRGHDRRADRQPQARRARPGEDPRCLRRGRRPPGPADGDPGADQEGLRHGQRRPGPHDHAQPEEARRCRPDRVPRPLQAAADRRAGARADLLPAGRRIARDALPEGPARGAGRRHATAQRGLRAAARAGGGKLRAVRPRRCRQGDEHHHGLRAHAGRPAEGRAARPAHRAHRGRRGTHLRHGQPVQAGGHLQQRGPALRAGGHRLRAQLPGGAGRPDPGRRHQRGRRHRQLDGRRHQLQRARPGHAAVLHLLLDVRLPARGRCHLGRRRPARARLFAGGHVRPHHAGRRRPAAPGRLQPSGGRHHPQLQGLGPGVRGRAGSHHGPRHARDAGRAARRLLLRHADERELRPTRSARRGARRCAPWLLSV